MTEQPSVRRACVDCRFYSWRNGSTWGECTHADAATFDSVLGLRNKQARERRFFRAGSCGPNGLQWEARPPVPSSAKGCAIMLGMALFSCGFAAACAVSNGFTTWP